MNALAIPNAVMLRGPLPAASPVESLTIPEQLAHMSGIAMLQIHATLYWPVINAGDVLRVDFDRRGIEGDGLYLLAMDDARPGEAPYSRRWFGARRFQKMPSGLYICEETPRDGQQWVRATPSMVSRFTVFGLVLDVYKTVNGGLQ